MHFLPVGSSFPRHVLRERERESKREGGGMKRERGERDRDRESTRQMEDILPFRVTFRGHKPSPT